MSMLRFAADTAWGRVRLDLPSPDEHRDAVAHALAVEAAHGLIDALEQWGDAVLDVSPCTEVSDDAAVLASITDASLAPTGSRLALPWRWMAAAPRAVPPALSGHGVSWERIPVICELARFDAAPLPANALDDGGVLLLPPSFDAHWTLRLVSSILDMAMDAPCTGLNSPWRLAVPPQAVDASEQAWRVVLADALLLHPLQCLPGNDTTIHWPRQLAAHLLPPGSTEPVARGRLMPALAGAALWVAPAIRPAPTQATTLDAQPA
ncbi:hypothetical protein [Piscinibacter terrae]|uniref:Uncharacterized protein n=1 Tax=Piscinibacter terrae TaxID=2496871 RepID=A0A3N7HGX8_9BURK|nr:hypothetical protein [Albitalea terrae]RQP21274.1 hypothetical protein DZC73_28985 [Albitalea terrae]